MKSTAKYRTVDEYFSSQESQSRVMLEALRATIKKAAPQAEEVISYNMPAYKLNGILVYYAAAKNHIGFYPTPSAILAFQKELSAYRCARGTVQFPMDKPLPLRLIDKMVKFRVKENMEKAGLAKQAGKVK